MKCPECGTWTVVLETRNGLRRRQCAGAAGEVHTFSTREVVERPPSLLRREKMAQRDMLILDAIGKPGATQKSVADLLKIAPSSIRNTVRRSASRKSQK